MSIEINPAELVLLREAFADRQGELRVKIAGGKVTEADHERCRHAEVLEHVGFLVEIGQQGAFQVWRLTEAARALAGEVRATRR